MSLSETSNSATLLISDLLELVKSYSTPFYVYDLATLRRQCKEFENAFPYPWFQLFFATMANDRKVVLQDLAGLEVGACVNSIPHLELALESGFLTKRIQFTSTGVSKPDMKHLLSHGVRLNADSVNQLEQWASLGGREVGLRVNAACLSIERPADRIGMSLEDISLAHSSARSHGLKISGLHVYIGTNLQSHEQLLPTIDNLFRFAEQFDDLEYINIGGGVGVNYQHKDPKFDLGAYGRAIASYHSRLTQEIGRSLEIIVEPGRKLTASCGKMITKITDIKYLHGRRYVTVDASVAIFPRPFHHPESTHNVWLLAAEQDKVSCSSSEAVVVGRTTFSRDILGVTMLADNIEIDDVLVFDDAGSYSQSMETRFLGQPVPVIVPVHK